MGASCSSIAFTQTTLTISSVSSSATSLPHYSHNWISSFIPTFPRDRAGFSRTSFHISGCPMMNPSSSSSHISLGFSKCGETKEAQEKVVPKPFRPPLSISQALRENLVYDALVWSSLNGLVVGDRSVKRSGTTPGVGMVHAPFALLPLPLQETYWKQACELQPIFNELVDRVSLDGNFLQDSLSRTKKVDSFTSRLLDIHSKMLEINKKEVIRLGLHRSDYMLDAETDLLLQIELNTISSSFSGLGCLVSDLHRYLLNQHGKELGLNPVNIPENTAVRKFAEAIAKAWNEYSNKRAVVMFVVQPEERNMYDQHWLSFWLKEIHGVNTIRKTLAEIDVEGQLLPDGSLAIGDQTVAVVYFRAGYSPNDYPSESEWNSRLLMEQSTAVKCPSISYHLVGTKKIQQELAKPLVLERFLEEDAAAKLRKCFAGLWSLDDSEVVKRAIERPELFVLKPQREGGGNNIYGDDVKEMLLKLQQENSKEQAAYILMQRIFPAASVSYLIREGIPQQGRAISELGIYGAYLKNNDKVIMNEKCGYLMRTKDSSSNEGGVATGFAVLDSIYLT
ncbi:glutathione synthetase, chloroplastic [Phalaenopsis equestris]|uniref:glutathione synthetase, chloroplastic n=1 Tax=Phalaenopsis equestris TaxID=78828 RepID=UPI0009E63FBD|nr:glutathione synthetase, chloroplastic [Phalaenopsis equestris]